ncbi:hypothetical protein ABFU82_22465 [Nocardioides sp. WV_118_6]
MSGHLIGCAGDLKTIPGTASPTSEGTPMPTSHKLALLAFADSADNITHIGFAGYAGVQKWAVCSRGRAAELIRDLVTWGLLRPHKRGHRGQRAEYVVFPNGCCDLHRKPADEPAVDVEQLAAAAGVSVDQARKMLAAVGGDAGGEAVVQPEGPDGATGEKGSDAPDANPLNGSDALDPSAPDVPQQHAEPVDNPGKGPERVHGSRSTADAFTSPTTNPPTPASGGAGCAIHDTPVPGRRCCGTTPRQIEAAARKAANAQRRDDAIAAAEAERSTPKGRGAGATSAKAAVRAGVALGRQRAKTKEQTR